MKNKIIYDKNLLKLNYDNFYTRTYNPLAQHEFMLDIISNYNDDTLTIGQYIDIVKDKYANFYKGFNRHEQKSLKKDLVKRSYKKIIRYETDDYYNIITRMNDIYKNHIIEYLAFLKMYDSENKTHNRIRWKQIFECYLEETHNALFIENFNKANVLYYSDNINSQHNTLHNKDARSISDTFQFGIVNTMRKFFPDILTLFSTLNTVIELLTNDDMLTTNMFNTEYKIENIYTLLKHINICVDKKYNQKENIKQVEYLNKLLLNKIKFLIYIKTKYKDRNDIIKILELIDKPLENIPRIYQLLNKPDIIKQQLDESEMTNYTYQKATQDDITYVKNGLESIQTNIFNAMTEYIAEQNNSGNEMKSDDSSIQPDSTSIKIKNDIDSIVKQLNDCLKNNKNTDVLLNKFIDIKYKESTIKDDIQLSSYYNISDKIIKLQFQYHMEMFLNNFLYASATTKFDKDSIHLEYQPFVYGKYESTNKYGFMLNFNKWRLDYGMTDYLNNKIHWSEDLNLLTNYCISNSKMLFSGLFVIEDESLPLKFKNYFKGFPNNKLVLIKVLQLKIDQKKNTITQRIIDIYELFFIYYDETKNTCVVLNSKGRIVNPPNILEDYIITHRELNTLSQFFNLSFYRCKKFPYIYLLSPSLYQKRIYSILGEEKFKLFTDNFDYVIVNKNYKNNNEFTMINKWKQYFNIPKYANKNIQRLLGENINLEVELTIPISEQNPYLYSNFMFSKMGYEYIKNNKGIGTVRIIDNAYYEVFLNLSNIVNRIEKELTSHDNDNIEINDKINNIKYYIFEIDKNILLFIYNNGSFIKMDNDIKIIDILNDAFGNIETFNTYTDKYKIYNSEWTKIKNEYKKDFRIKYLKYKNKYLLLKNSIVKV
jgi:hypothetical protein